MNNKQLIAEITQIARRAGEAILKIYANEADFQVEHKSDSSPLTIADRTANAIICSALEALHVQYPIISEENKQIPYAERQHFQKAWLVDPLDGTKEFLKRNGDFTVNIALINAGVIELGVVYIPVFDEMYYAAKGEGAFVAKAGKVEPIQALPFSMSDPGLKVICSRSHMSPETEVFIQQLDQPELVSRGSSLKFLLIAMGQAHVYPRMGPTMEWDTGAAQIILEEAGGEVIDQNTQQPLRYNKENLLNPYFVAYGKVSAR
ncbi:3'(2'),5'-bisphosphate nucleotidase CysQ [Haliscomenobacter hydrossis]|uniref:3'(2'),5'-bisphosphate nucleotidase CysQ n=1 Tax=Haliscomenobacter hydrossis (strain ATCC 27775 / DSM 1100 / LMG 10767 / O) TaxID=760192 RepID=F4KVJ9_HALH1|nr:3'(2'),5'-bisphosphate nucleotidase CysQ [Haliscomenobacter hydrossis]AEE51312.1 3'(2'),5'-bisphosphate nucleotidase [Haliscomenobacter hydrossis DSM 1100]